MSGSSLNAKGNIISILQESAGERQAIFPAYNDGACLPLPGPSGWRWQAAAVKLLSEEFLCPQYWQMYCACSPPS